MVYTIDLDIDITVVKKYFFEFEKTYLIFYSYDRE